MWISLCIRNQEAIRSSDKKNSDSKIWDIEIWFDKWGTLVQTKFKETANMVARKEDQQRTQCANSKLMDTLYSSTNTNGITCHYTDVDKVYWLMQLNHINQPRIKSSYPNSSIISPEDYCRFRAIEKLWNRIFQDNGSLSCLRRPIFFIHPSNQSATY